MTSAVQILLARHGNTFASGDRVVWVGRETDLPLVPRGIAQAHEAAAELSAQGLLPTTIIAARLARTRMFADLMAKDLGIADVHRDGRLDEVDYGSWAGKTAEEIGEAGGGAALEAWQKADVWPEGVWRTSKQELFDGLRCLLDEIGAGAAGARPLLVSSNGVLRWLPRLLDIDWTGSLQLKTGHLGCLDRDPSGAWQVRFWGLAPRKPA